MSANIYTQRPNVYYKEAALNDTQALPVFPLQSDFLGGSKFLTKGKFLTAANRPSNLIRECSISKGLLSFHVSSPQLRQEGEVSCFVFVEVLRTFFPFSLIQNLPQVSSSSALEMAALFGITCSCFSPFSSPSAAVSAVTR